MDINLPTGDAAKKLYLELAQGYRPTNLRSAIDNARVDEVIKVLTFFGIYGFQLKTIESALGQDRWEAHKEDLTRIFQYGQDLRNTYGPPKQRVRRTRGSAPIQGTTLTDLAEMSYKDATEMIKNAPWDLLTPGQGSPPTDEDEE